MVIDQGEKLPWSDVHNQDTEQKIIRHEVPSANVVIQPCEEVVEGATASATGLQIGNDKSQPSDTSEGSAAAAAAAVVPDNPSAAHNQVYLHFN